MTAQTSNAQTIAIAGAGLIGLSCGFELAQRGHDVTLFDPAPAQASTGWAAAGMIAPAYEWMLQADNPDDAFASFCFESSDLWADFSAQVEAATGQRVGYSPRPTAALARTPQEDERLAKLREYLVQLGRPAQILSPKVLELDYGLAPGLRGGLRLMDDHQVDNRRLIAALRSFFVSQQRLIAVPVSSRADIETASGRSFDAIIWARGSEETGISQRVKGQAIALSPVAGQPGSVLRFGPRYIVPKADRTIVGATSESEYSSDSIDPDIARSLLAEAASVLPVLSRANILEHWAGFRPLGQGERPVIGALGDGAFIATAHYRNGVLLAPATARLIADQVEGHSFPQAYTGFAPRQGSGATA